MRVTTEQSPALFELASSKIGATFRHDWNHRLLSLVGEHGVVAQAALTQLCPGVRGEVSFWSDGKHGLSCAKLMLDTVRVAFLQMDVERLEAHARVSHEGAARLLLRAGFRPEARLRRFYGDEDGVVYNMLRSECRWLKGTRP